MKKITTLLIASLIVASLLSGCGNKDAAIESTEREQGVAIGEEGNGETIVTQTPTEEFVYDKEGDFLLVIDDFFTITGQGTVVTGRIQRGTVKVGDTVELVGQGSATITTTVTQIEKFRETLDEAYAGDNVGLYLDGVSRQDLQRNQAVIAPGTITPITKFTADITLEAPEAAGVTEPFTPDMEATFWVWLIEASASATFEEGVTEIPYGESATITITLNSPIVVLPGAPVNIRYGEHEIGKGTVIEILE